MLIRHLRAAIVAVTLLGQAVPIHADTFVLSAGADTWLSSTEPNSNFGGSTELRMMGWVGLGSHRPMLKFDLSSIPDTWTVLSAKISIFQNGFASGSWENFPIEISRLANDSWQEDLVTFSNYSPASEQAVGSIQPPHPNTLREFEVLMSEWTYGADLADDAVTFQLRWGAEMSQQYKDVGFMSRESTIQPTLTVVAVPDPAGSAVLGVGALSLFLRRRKG